MKNRDAEERQESADRRGDGVPERHESRLKHHEITRVIIGAMYAVHSELGAGFLETVYKNAVTLLLRNAGLEVFREAPYQVLFHGEMIGLYRADLVVESKVVVEVKTGRLIDPAHTAQLLNYLRASRINVGLLLNFGPRVEFKRIICTPRQRTVVTDP